MYATYHRGQKAIGSSGAVSHLNGCWKSNSGPMEQQQVLLITKPSFQLSDLFSFLKILVICKCIIFQNTKYLGTIYGKNLLIRAINFSERYGRKRYQLTEVNFT